MEKLQQLLGFTEKKELSFTEKGPYNSLLGLMRCVNKPDPSGRVARRVKQVWRLLLSPVSLSCTRGSAVAGH